MTIQSTGELTTCTPDRTLTELDGVYESDIRWYLTKKGGNPKASY